jgi:hypothetical protein
MKGGKADKLTLPKIAKKHGVPIENLMSQFKLGMKTEMEHTDNKKQAKEIAMDHLAENPKYYTKLKKAKLEEAVAKSLATAALGLGLMGNPSVTKANQPTPLSQQQTKKVLAKVSFSRSEPISNPDLDLVHGALGSKRLTDDFEQRVQDELSKQAAQGHNPDVTNLLVNTFIEGNQIVTEASCDIIESQDGIGYTHFTTRGSIGGDYDRRHDGQVTGLVDRLESHYGGIAKQVGKTFTITFQVNGQTISYKQSFFVVSDSKQPQMQQSQQTQTISGKDFGDLRQKLKEQTKDISIDPNSIEIDIDNFSISYKLGNEKIKVISLIYDDAGQLETRLISVKNQNPTLEVLEKGKSGNVDWVVSIILADKSLKESLKYPIEDKGKWYGDEDYEKRNGKIIYMNPDEFLSKAKELKIDDAARENIDDIKEHIKNGKKLDPLALYSSDKTNVRNSDGRHRAIAAKELGIKKVPVIDFTSSELKEDAIPSKLKSDVEIEYHKKLNPKFWLNNHLKSGIRKNLLNLANFYFKQLDLGVKLKDIIFTGSLANYNYTNLSDIDIHIIIDYKKLTNDEDFAKEFFSNKRSIWADSNDIKINGFPVEIYVQDVSELDDIGMGAMYSLLNNKWIRKPTYKLPEVDKHLITTKVNKYLDIFNKISMMDDSIKKIDSYNKVFEKIRTERKKATQEEGEFSVDNLVFKVLRSKGVFDIIKNNKKEIVNNLFSMKTN